LVRSFPGGDDLGGGRRFHARAWPWEANFAKDVSQLGAAGLAAGRSEGECVLEDDHRHSSGGEAQLTAFFQRL